MIKKAESSQRGHKRYGSKEEDREDWRKIEKTSNTKEVGNTEITMKTGKTLKT